MALTTTTSTGLIYYTVDGTTPTLASATVAPGGLVSITGTTTVRALTAASGYGPSGVATLAYTILPVAAGATKAGYLYSSNAGPEEQSREQTDVDLNAHKTHLRSVADYGIRKTKRGASTDRSSKPSTRVNSRHAPA